MSIVHKTSVPLSILLLIVLSFSAGWYFSAEMTRKKALQNKHPSRLEKIKKRKKLNVVLLNSPSSYYIGASGPTGFEYDLVQSYARRLGVDLNITTAHTVKEALSYANDPDIDIISATLTKTKKRKKLYNFGPTYFEVQEQVICNRKLHKEGRFPKDIEDLSDNTIAVGEETSYEETLNNLIDDGFDLNVTVVPDLSTEELLEQVSKGKIDCTVSDSNIYAINLRYYTNLSMAFNISGTEELGWIIPFGANKLEADLYEWINALNQSGKMIELKDHYYSYIFLFDYYDKKMFYKRIKSRLPKYMKYFKAAGKKYHIPWTLLAAQSYQESHWNPRAKSFTGVRGLMMLTRKTAKLLGVRNRLDPKQSVMGGAKHLSQLLKLVPATVEGENRLKYALAAYNIGLGHILDAMKLAGKMGLNPNSWADLKRVLPYLSQKKYYKRLKYGYARGSEPVRYVDGIYDYKDILEKQFIIDVESKKRQEEIKNKILPTGMEHSHKRR